MTTRKPRFIKREKDAYRLLLTGSRYWTQCGFFDLATTLLCWELWNIDITLNGHQITAIVGDCPTGVDRWARDWGEQEYGWNVEVHRADWDRYGHSAGPKRNREMVNQNPDACLAFIKDNSPGASNCMNLAVTAGVPTYIYRFNTRGIRK